MKITKQPTYAETLLAYGLYVWLKGSCHVFISPEPGDGFMSLLSRACCGHAKTLGIED